MPNFNAEVMAKSFPGFVEKVANLLPAVVEAAGKVEQALLKQKDDNSCENNIATYEATQAFIKASNRVIKGVYEIHGAHNDIVHHDAPEQEEDTDMPAEIMAILQSILGPGVRMRRG